VDARDKRGHDEAQRHSIRLELCSGLILYGAARAPRI
jgi:hypothetical protein